jgi:hypothetical protein
MIMTSQAHPYYPLVRLKDDPTFRGYAFGRYITSDGEETNEVVVSVSDPGNTKLTGCIHIDRERLEVIG